MNVRITVMLLFVFAVLSGISNAAETENYIQVKGESCVNVKPDVAHCFLIVADYGKNYEASSKAANEKLDQLKSLLKITLKETPEITVIKIDNKPKNKSFDQQRYLTEMAKAIKGETPGKLTDDKIEFGTHITVYFTMTNFSRESILGLMNSLAEKEIAFEKSISFEYDYSSEFTVGKSMMYFGLQNPDKQIGLLASEAFYNAEHDAKIIAAAIKKNLVGLINVTGCGNIIEGNVTMPDNSYLTGKSLGPLSSDPTRLIIRFNKDFGFRIE